MQKSRLELLQEYKKQKILKQKNLNSLPNKTLKNVQNIRTKSSFTTSDPPSTSISDTSCDTIKSDNNTSIKSDTSKGFISKTLKSDTSMGFISKSSDKKNTSKSISNSSAAQEITIPELEEPPLDTTTNTVDSNYNPSNLDDLNTVERVSLPTDLILLNIELDSLKQQLQSILSENQDLKSQLQQYSSTKDEYRVEIIKELILLVESARVNGKGWDQLVLELDSLKFSSVNSEQVDIVVESAKQVQQQKEQELKQELKDAYQVIDHYELEIKEYEIMALVKENELNELEQALKQSLLDNQILEEKVKDLETKLEDKEFMDELKQIDAKNSSAVQDEKSQKQQDALEALKLMKLSANIIYQNSQSELKKHNQLQQQLVSERDELKKIVTDKDVVVERLLKGVEVLGKKNKDLEQKILKIEAKRDGKSWDECENTLDKKDSEAE